MSAERAGGDRGVLAELIGIGKVYPNGVVALRGVDIALATGEVHAIVGENGAGKSSLMKILFGLEHPTVGEIRLGGTRINSHSPAAAIAAGIGMVHQHFQLVRSLTVAENLILGQEPRTGPLLDQAAAIRTVEALGDLFGIVLDPKACVGELAVGDQQRLEILKALNRGANLLILDEPTAVLTPQETDRLLESVQHLANKGTGVVLITHKLREVMDAAAQITVLRGGRRVWTKPRSEVTPSDITRAMMGHEIELAGRHERGTPGRLVLSLRGVHTGGRQPLQGIDLEVQAGQIVGVAGVEGNGQEELIDVVSGLRPLAAGEVLLDGKPLTRLSPRQRRQRGLAHIAADRIHRGTAGSATIGENLVADRVRTRQFSTHGLIERRRVRKAAERAVANYAIQPSNATATVDSLSGGNVQKVVVARELDGEPTLILAAHPSRGIDVGTMRRIHGALVERRAAGAAILLVSSDLDEIRALADRIVVLYEGRLVARYDDLETVSDAEIGTAMAGLTS